tara:strand:- start:1682 stop:1864 length:183 start_codon:yes stop_codon:yes gene_type:complete
MNRLTQNEDQHLDSLFDIEKEPMSDIDAMKDSRAEDSALHGSDLLADFESHWEKIRNENS